MPRIRTVKPDYFTHPEIVALTLPARLLLLSLLTQADDEGRLYDQPWRIAANSFGDGDRIKPDRLLEELAQTGRIIRYEKDGKRLIQVVNFKRHQSISKLRPSSLPPPDGFHDESSTIPEPFREEGGNEEEPNQPDSEKPPRGKGKERNRNGKGSLSGPQSGERGRDEIFEAVVEVCGWNLETLTKDARGRANSAARQLREVGADPALIRGFRNLWVERYPAADITPQAITNNWPSYMAGNLFARAKR